MTPIDHLNRRTTAAEIASDWGTWSRTLGTLALPRLQAIQDDVPGLQAAMLCTADGLNIAAVGVDDRDVGRLAALSSSLFGVADAHRDLVDPEAGSTMVHIAGGNVQSVLVRFEVTIIGPLLLVVSAEEDTLGLIVVAARTASEALREQLEPAG